MKGAWWWESCLSIVCIALVRSPGELACTVTLIRVLERSFVTAGLYLVLITRPARPDSSPDHKARL